MKKTILALAALALATPAFAQQTGGTVGIGVSIVPLDTGSFSFPTVEVYVPIRVAPQLRLEPSFGLQTADRPTGSGQPDTRDFTLGLGVFYVHQLAAPLDLYAGGRVKLNFAKVESNEAPFASNTGTDVVLAAALGGEYFFVPKFSLGLEGQLGYVSRSSASIDEADGFFTTGLAFLRLYF
ncbi:MAG TPA: outer membrane beta-barrel protein [Anaeromyxobacteraceae bacterium]|nr:outer membrane beta-barrel protein [Anaeromyxobacteraceae bacterium]